MSRTCTTVAAALMLSGCSRRPIEDGQQVGPLIQMKDSFTSCFLLEYDPGRFAVFDTCNAGSARAIERTLEDFDADLGDVTRVFLTHGHADHLGGLGRLEKVAVSAHGDERDRIKEEGHQVNRSLADGSDVVLGDYTVRAFHVPGHTEGSMVYEVEGVLVMGDVVIAQRDGSLEPPPERYSDDPAESDRSVRALARQLDEGEVEVEWIAPAHSGPVQGIEALLAF